MLTVEAFAVSVSRENAHITVRIHLNYISVFRLAKTPIALAFQMVRSAVTRLARNRMLFDNRSLR